MFVLNQVLNGITLDVDEGTVVALVGPSGGGKSTIVSMMERLYDPTQGEISVRIRAVGMLPV